MPLNSRNSPRRVRPLSNRVKSKLESDSSFSVVTIQRFNESRERSAALFLIVNSLGFELLPVRVRTINRDGPRFTIRRDRALALGEHFSAFHRRNPVGVVVHNFVGRRVPSKVPLHLIGFAISLAHPDAVPRFPILIYTVHRYLHFVLHLGVHDRVVLPHSGCQLRLRFIELPRTHMRIGRKTSCYRQKRQSQSHHCNSSFYHAAIPPEMPVRVNTNSRADGARPLNS